MKIAILCTAFLALLQLFLGLAVSTMRWKYKLAVGTPDDPNHPLSRTRTALSNCAEWHPILIALMLVLQMTGAPAWSIWLSPLVVMARYLLVAGLVTYSNTRPNALRAVGACLTYVLVLILAVLVMATFWPSASEAGYLPSPSNPHG